jgi:hypothetical protein
MLVDVDKVWFPDQIAFYDPFDFWTKSNYYKYYISFFQSVLFLTGNDTNPVGDSQTLFNVLALVLGSVVNATIFGNMALLILEMNKSSDEF